MYSRRRGEISHTQKTCEATGGRDRFSDIIVLMVPATVFFPSSRFNRRPDFSTKNTATVNAERKQSLHNFTKEIMRGLLNYPKFLIQYVSNRTA